MNKLHVVLGTLIVSLLVAPTGICFNVIAIAVIGIVGKMVTEFVLPEQSKQKYRKFKHIKNV